MPSLSVALRDASSNHHQADTRLSLDQLRAQIDEVDDAILELIERRDRLVRRIGEAKDADAVDLLKFKPRREAHVLTRLLRQARPATRPLVLAVWRELMSAGLAAQQTLTVAIWDGGEAHVTEGARRRFGSFADYLGAPTPKAALERARAGGAVAVLALRSDSPWWKDLALSYPDLWICEAIEGPRGRIEPAALAVGRLDPATLPPGRAFISSLGGDAGHRRAAMRLLGIDTGARLCLADEISDAPITPHDRRKGVLGRAPVLSVESV